MLRKPLLAASAAIVAFATNANAVQLFSVDVVNDELVRIESTTGAVDRVGALGNVTLARTSDRRLWALNADVGNRVDFWEINRNIGAVTSSVQVMLGGNPVLGGEGLAVRNDAFLIAYSSNGDFVSDQLVDLATDGTVTNSRAVAIDVDGMTTGTGGGHELYAIDREFDTRLYGMVGDTGATTLLGTYSASLFFSQTVSFLDQIIAIDWQDSDLYTIDLSNGASLSAPLQLQDVSFPNQYRGLVLADEVPSPGGIWFLILGIGLIALRRLTRA